MPTTPARIAANRKNAQKSSGPKTEAGKERSRLNAFRHGLAGRGDLVNPGEDLDLIERRTVAFLRELAAPGEVGELLAHRAAVLSVRMEKAADREFKAVAASEQAGRDQFDSDHAERLDDWLLEAEESDQPGPALHRLESDPEGLLYVRRTWRTLHAAVANDDEAATDRAAGWLGLIRLEGSTPANLLPGIEAEIARLDALAQSSTLQEAALLVTIRRREAGRIASFDPSPEATLARRYEGAAERGMYRAIREIRELRRNPLLVPATLPQPLYVPPVYADSPSEPTSSSGSFREDLATVSVGRPNRSNHAPQPPRSRPDVRQLAANRR